MPSTITPGASAKHLRKSMADSSFLYRVPYMSVIVAPARAQTFTLSSQKVLFTSVTAVSSVYYSRAIIRLSLSVVAPDRLNATFVLRWKT